MATHDITIKGIDKFSDAFKRISAQLNETTQGLTEDEKRHARDEAVLKQGDEIFKMTKNWQCPYCGYLNFAFQETCGQDEAFGCGTNREVAQKAFVAVLVGSFQGKPVYDSDLRRWPELKQHKDFTLVLGEGCLDVLRWHSKMDTQ